MQEVVVEETLEDLTRFTLRKVLTEQGQDAYFDMMSAASDLAVTKPEIKGYESYHIIIGDSDIEGTQQGDTRSGDIAEFLDKYQ